MSRFLIPGPSKRFPEGFIPISIKSAITQKNKDFFSKIIFSMMFQTLGNSTTRTKLMIQMIQSGGV